MKVVIILAYLLVLVFMCFIPPVAGGSYATALAVSMEPELYQVDYQQLVMQGMAWTALAGIGLVVAKKGTAS